jgi:hypothetical protein
VRLPSQQKKAKYGGVFLSFQLWWERIKVQAGLTKNQSKKVGGVAHTVEHLPRKCETPSSSPSTTKEMNIYYHYSHFTNGKIVG